MSIKVDHVSYTYMPGTPFEHQALYDVSFEIPDGDFVGIVGHTGSGKSTLVQIISGLIRGYEGHVYVNGIDFSDKKQDRRELRKQVGVVFQYPEYQLFEESVEKDIAYGPTKLGVDPKEVERRVKAAMDLVELDYDLFRDKSPFSLSGGQKRKVAIAGVLAMEPKILIMDEPIAGLDPMGRENFMQLVRSLNECGITILMVSHNMDNLAEYTKHVLVMNDGRLFMQGTPEEIFSDYMRLREASLDLPEVAQFAQMLRSRGMDIPPHVIRYDQLKELLLQRFGGNAACCKM